MPRYNLRPRILRPQSVQPLSLVPLHRSYHPYRPYFPVLDNDSLLNIFYLCRPTLVNEEGADDEDNMTLWGGERHHEFWWYKLAHVCRRWRNLILASPSYLGLRHVCTYGTPVADMLVHSPPFLLIIDYVDNDREVTAEDDKGILFALQHRDRIRRIRLQVRRPVLILQELITAIDEEFPMLEYLDIRLPTTQDTSITLPNTLQAPRLNRLILHNFAFPIGSPLLTTAAALVTLTLSSICILPLTVLFQRLSTIPQLETLIIGFHSPISDQDIETPVSRSMTHIILPSLRWFEFKGTNAYLEALLPWITTPLLEKFQIVFFNQLVFSIPHLLQFARTTENLRFRSATITFSSHGVSMDLSPREGASVYPFHMHVICKHHDWQVGCASQIFNAFSTVFSVVELTLKYGDHPIASGLSQDDDYTEWRELLTSFSDLKTLRIDDELVQPLTRSRQLEYGNSTRELLPELRELPCIGFKDPGGPLATQFAGCLATLVLSQPITHHPSQQSFQLHKIPPLLEDRFKNALWNYMVVTGIGFTKHDLALEGRQINLWALHKSVFLRNGYEAVTANDEWPTIGAALGFPSFAGGVGQPARCAPAVAHQLQQSHNHQLRHFEQVYISSVMAWLRGPYASDQAQRYQLKEEAQRRDEKAEADDREAMEFFEYVIKFIGEKSDAVIAKPASIDFETILRSYRP